MYCKLRHLLSRVTGPSELTLPASRLPWVLLARPMERLRWLRFRNWEKEEVESMVFLRVPKALVGNRNWV